MRIYDARLGKFLSVDPLSSEYPWNSTYAYAENDVIRSIDLDGLEKVALSGAAPPSQYLKRGADGSNLLGRTAYNSWHVNGFKTQADRLKKQYGFESNQVFNGQQIISHLKQATRVHGYVSFIAIFLHGGIAQNPDNTYTSGLFMSNSKGLYQNNVDVASREPGYATIADIKKSMSDGSVKFSKDATIFIDGCNATGSAPGIPPDVNFAYELVMSTGVTVIAASGHAAMVDEKKYDGRFKIPDSDVGSFFRLSREEYWEDEEMLNPLRGTYGGENSTIKLRVQKFRVIVENLGRETKLMIILKRVNEDHNLYSIYFTSFLQLFQG